VTSAWVERDTAGDGEDLEGDGLGGGFAAMGADEQAASVAMARAARPPQMILPGRLVRRRAAAVRLRTAAGCTSAQPIMELS
jgi:hypothetical protein